MRIISDIFSIFTKRKASNTEAEATATAIEKVGTPMNNNARFFNAPMGDVIAASTIHFGKLKAGKTYKRKKTDKPRPYTVVFAFTHPKTGDLIVSNSRKYFSDFHRAYLYYKKAVDNMGEEGLVILMHNHDRSVRTASVGRKKRIKK